MPSLMRRWVESPSGIAGIGLAALATVAQIFLGLTPLWPLVSLAAFGAGALLAPGPRPRFEIRYSADLDPDQLASVLQRLRKDGDRSKNRLGPEAHGALSGLLDALDEVLGRWEVLAGAPRQLHVVESMITEYIPDSLAAFAALPSRMLDAPGRAGAPTPRQELVGQLGVLGEEAEALRTAVYQKDVDSLADHGRFLRAKFRSSELDL